MRGSRRGGASGGRPPPADAQTEPVGAVIATATWIWTFNDDGTIDETTDAAKKYLNIVDNFFQKGATSYGTSIEFEEVMRRGVLAGEKVTARCSPDHVCTWNGGDVDDDRGKDCDRSSDGFDPSCNFTLTYKEVEVPEVVDYVDVSQDDVDAQRDPKGTVPAGPRSRTATYSVPGHLTCGDLFGQAYVWTVKDELLVATYYVEVYSRDDNGDVVVPFVVTGCVLRDPDEPYHPIVEQVDANGDTVIDTSTNLPELVKASEPQMRGGRPVTAGEALPATRAPITDCSMLEGTPRGSECVVTYHEYTSPDAAGEVPRPATGRLASITHPGDAPEYEPPTEREVEACNRRSDHETCINKLEADALNDYYRALEAHDAKVQRYEQELDNLAYDIDDDPATPETPRGEPFWVCTSYEQWKRDVEEGYTTGQRCYLVG